MLSRFKWVRDPANPVLPPDPGLTLRLFAMHEPLSTAYRLHNSGGDANGQKRICIATGTNEDIADAPHRQGNLLDPIGEDEKLTDNL
jgi:hypothetical protein